MNHFLTLSLASSLFIATSAFSLDVKLSPQKDYIEVVHQGTLIKVERIQDQDHILEGSFAKTSRKCPPFCIQPISAGEGVKTVGQLELLNFMEDDLLNETGVIIDARIPAWHLRGTIPGSVNIPFTLFNLDSIDSGFISAMKSLGVKHRVDVNWYERLIEKMGFMGGDQKNDTWDFTAAKKLVLWCNGPWCEQAPLAIKRLLKLGYPPDKLFYYRGGMQAWQSLGLTVVVP